MKKRSSTIFLLGLMLTSISLCLILVPKNITNAQTTGGIDTAYSPLVAINGLTDTQTTNADIGPYISGAYKWVISLSIALAVVMFTFYAFQYLLSESTITSKSKAKEGMQNVIIGLLLIFSAYLILKTINPQLVTFNLSVIQPAARQGGTGTQPLDCNSNTPPSTGVFKVTKTTCTSRDQGGNVTYQPQAVYTAYAGTIDQCNAEVSGVEGVTCQSFGLKFTMKYSAPNTTVPRYEVYSTYSFETTCSAAATKWNNWDHPENPTAECVGDPVTTQHPFITLRYVNPNYGGNGYRYKVYDTKEACDAAVLAFNSKAGSNQSAQCYSGIISN